MHAPFLGSARPRVGISGGSSAARVNSPRAPCQDQFNVLALGYPHSYRVEVPSTCFPPFYRDSGSIFLKCTDGEVLLFI